MDIVDRSVSDIFIVMTDWSGGFEALIGAMAMFDGRGDSQDVER